jgi:putative tryptophan/tyrosine transport system substrate-binding protein
MGRREFTSLLGGAAAFPLAAHAQQGGPIRRIGVLHGLATDDSAAKTRAFATGLGALCLLGWHRKKKAAALTA